MKHRILAIVCSIAAAFTASAQVPSLINYQGRLTDSNGAPVTGNKNFAISIYDAATGGNLLYEETIGAVTLDANGVYSFQFGSAGSSNTQVTETIGTTAGTTLTYSKALSNTPVVNNSITVTDGTNSWSQSVGNPGVGATATANTISGFVIGATITNGGSGYTSAPSVTITGSGTGATATATISGGVVTGITINSAGSGYTGGATITIAPPVIPFRVDYSGGTITATYSSAPTAGQTISATYRYTTSAITAAISASSEQWLQLSVDGVNQVPRQRVLAVPYALRADTAIQAQTAITATTVADGSITESKLSPNALTTSLGNNGNIIISQEVRNDLISQGFIEVGQTDASSVSYGAAVARSSSEDTAVWTGSELIAFGLDNGNIGSRYNYTTNTWSNITANNAPEKRAKHTAIWTGTEMIVWGGRSDISSSFIYAYMLSTGAKYNPSSNTWTQVTNTNAPASRFSHSAVWTGNEMIVFGGFYPSDSSSSPYIIGRDTGARYNPSTNTWAAISSVNAPSGRGLHTAIWTGTEMIVWGGSSNGVATNTGARYNPSNDTWSTMSTVNAPTARNGHTAVWTGSEMIIWGGSQGMTGSRYNPTTNSWNTMNKDNCVSGKGVWTDKGFIAWDAINGYGAIYDVEANIWNRILFNSNRFDPVKNSVTLTWLGDRLMLYGNGNVSFVKPTIAHLYAKP